MKRHLFAWFLGVLTALVAHQVWSAYTYLAVMPGRSHTAEPLPMQPVLDAPAVIRDGVPAFRAAHYSESADGRASTGVWASDGPSTFEWHFGSDEEVYVMHGRVDVNYGGKQFSLHPGDTAVFLAGSSAVWHVPQHVTKSYALHHPNALVRWWRKLTH